MDFAHLLAFPHMMGKCGPIDKLIKRDSEAGDTYIFEKLYAMLACESTNLGYVWAPAKPLLPAFLLASFF